MIIYKTMKYNIIRRSNTNPTSDMDLDFHDRKYDVPLCGCDNYLDELKVGDVVGVILSDPHQKK